MLDSGFRSGRVGRNFTDECATRSAQAKLLGDFGSHVLRVEPEIAAHNLAVFDELVRYGPRHVDRNGKADADVSFAAARGYGGVDADQIAVKVDHRSAGIPRIDRGVRLNEVLVIFDSEAAAPGGADDAHRGRFAHSKWIANGEDHVADLQSRGIADCKCGKTGRIDFQHCDVGSRIGADELGFEFALVAELHFDIGCAIDDVIVRQNRAVGRDDHARAEALFAFGAHLLLAKLIAEELLEEWIVEERHGVAFCGFTTFEL